MTVVTEENIQKVDKLIPADRRIKLWLIAEELHIMQKASWRDFS